MSIRSLNALARACWLASALVPAAPSAAQTTPLCMDLQQTAALAVSAQPLLDSLAARSRARRAQGIAARQLPDPEVAFGFDDLPVGSRDAFSFARDNDTQLKVGFAQDFPRAAKRRLRGALEDDQANVLTAERQLAAQRIRRDAALAWLDIWRYDQALRLARANLAAARAEQDAAAIALASGSLSQAAFIAARQEVARLRDAVQADQQSVIHARNTLSRWIGAAASHPICSEPLTLPEPPPAAVLLERLDRHPELLLASARIASADANAALADAEHVPDWRVELSYGNRPRYSDMVSVEVGIDLPLFAENRQDQTYFAALARKEASALDYEDAKRRLQAEIQLNQHDRKRLRRRLRDYAANLLPQSGARSAAALAAWRAGRGDFRDVLEARRAALDVARAELELRYDHARHVIQLSYLGSQDAPAEAGELP
jgi:outer membrane protein TolC